MRSSLMLDRRRKNDSILIVKREEPKAKAVKNTFLSKDDEKTYGDRFPSGYKKLKLLGRGGCAVVWLGEDPTGNRVAVKQVSRLNGINAAGSVEACKREVYFAREISKMRHPSLGNIARLIDTKTDKSDLWAIFELGGMSLSKALFELKGEFIRSERVYRIEHMPLYQEFLRNQNSFKKFITEMLGAIDLLSGLNIVHSDLKPDNILVNIRNDSFDSIKLIDFGSAYLFTEGSTLATSTPEYMPPEALEIAHEPGSRVSILQEISHPWSFDIWSLGMIILEIISGVPLWMSLKTKVIRGGRVSFTKGLLAVTGRDPSQILRQQQVIMSNLSETIYKCATMSVDSELYDLLEQMLAWDPSYRISPRAALRHPYLER